MSGFDYVVQLINFEAIRCVFVYSPHQSVAYIAQFYLHSSIRQSRFERGGSIDKGKIRSLALQFESYLSRHSVVGRLDKSRRRKVLLFVVQHCTEKFLGVLHTPHSRTYGYRFGSFEASLAESPFGGNDPHLYGTAHTTNGRWSNVISVIGLYYGENVILYILIYIVEEIAFECRLCRDGTATVDIYSIFHI